MYPCSGTSEPTSLNNNGDCICPANYHTREKVLECSKCPNNLLTPSGTIDDRCQCPQGLGLVYTGNPMYNTWYNRACVCPSGTQNTTDTLPTNISAVKKYGLTIDDDNFLNYGNNNSKNLYLLLLEDL